MDGTAKRSRLEKDSLILSHANRSRAGNQKGSKGLAKWDHIVSRVEAPDTLARTDDPQKTLNGGGPQQKSKNEVQNVSASSLTANPKPQIKTDSITLNSVQIGSQGKIIKLSNADSQNQDVTRIPDVSSTSIRSASLLHTNSETPTVNGPSRISKSNIDTRSPENPGVLRFQDPRDDNALKERVHAPLNDPKAMGKNTMTPILSKDTKDDLPVVAHREEFRRMCCSQSHPVVLVVGETGSGKTTKLPQYLLDDSKARRVCVTQPRRVAATTLAKRVAFERCQPKAGGEIGYRVRFDDSTSASTRLVFATDGLLLREAIYDPSLKQYDWIVLDEAHERSLNTDVLFGVIKRALKLRNKPGKIGLRVVVMSATIDVELFRTFFDALVMQVEGRQHPVDVWFLPTPIEDRVDACARSALQIHHDEPLPGDILIFLAGKDEIDACCQALKRSKENLIVCPLHASLPGSVQMKAFERASEGFRKIVVATNVAETSVTVDGVKFVVDSGVSKIKKRDKTVGIKKLAICPIAKSQAWQRCGRAGREAAGKCFRMYTETEFERMREDAEPEILRVDLSEVVMQLLALGVNNVAEFDFIQRPDKRALTEALTELNTLGAIAMNTVKGHLELTSKGRRMSALPVEPMYANLLLKAVELNCVRQVAGIVAMGGGVESPFYGQGDEANAARRKWTNPSGDHLTGLAVLDEFEAEYKRGTWKQFVKDNFLRGEVLLQALDARKQLVEICKGFRSEAGQEVEDFVIEPTTVPRCLATGLAARVAKKVGKSEYEPLLGGTKNGAKAFIHPSSVLSMLNLRPEYVVFDEMLVTSKVYLRGVSAVEDAGWLAQDQPSTFKQVPLTAGSTSSASENDAAIKKRIQERNALKMSRSHAVDSSI